MRLEALGQLKTNLTATRPETPVLLFCVSEYSAYRLLIFSGAQNMVDIFILAFSQVIAYT